MKLQDLTDELWFIAAPGAFGGVISWVLSAQSANARLVGPWVDLPLFAVLGSAAGLTFVVLLSNTNRSDTIRVVVLSFLAGLAWQPIINGGMSLVSGQEEIARIGEHVEAFSDLQRAVGGMAAANTTDEKAAADARTAEVLDRVPDAGVLPLSLRNSLGALYSELVDELPEARAENLRDTLERKGIELDDEPDSAAGGYFEAAVESIVPNRVTVPDSTTLVSVEAVAPPVLVPSVNATGVMVHIPIADEDEYAVEVTGDETDLVAALYNEFGLLLQADDDSGGDRNPSLKVRLYPGEYYLRVSVFTGGPVPDFEVRVRR